MTDVSEIRFATEYNPICCSQATRDLWALVNVRAKEKTEEEKQRTWGADVLFLIDASGSMADEGKMDQVKATLRYILSDSSGGLCNPNDRICAMAFNSGIVPLTPSFISVSDEERKNQALMCIGALRPRGGTDLDMALATAFEEFDQESEESSQHRIKFVVMLTDGLPTSGETDRSRIVCNAIRKNKQHVRVFAIGFGLDHDASLLAALPNSRYAYVRNTESIPGIMGEIMGDALSVTCLDACITLEAFSGCRIVSIGGRFQKENKIIKENKKVEIKLGDLSLGDSRNILVLLSLRPSENESQSRDLFAACMTWLLPDQSGALRISSSTLSCSVSTTADKSQETSQKRNQEIQEQMNRLTSLDAIEQADGLFREGKEEQALQVLSAAQKCIESTSAGDQPYSKNLVEDLGNCIKSLQLKTEADKTMTSCGAIYSSEKACGYDKSSCSNKKVYTTEACTKLSKNYEKASHSNFKTI